MRLGMAWPEEAFQTVGSTWYLEWQSTADISFRTRKKDGIRWYLLFYIKTSVYAFVLFNVLRLVKKKAPRLLGFGPIRRDPNREKLRRVVLFYLLNQHLVLFLFLF